MLEIQACFPGKTNEAYHILCQPLEPILITLMVEPHAKRSDIYHAWLLQGDKKVSGVKQFQTFGGLFRPAYCFIFPL